MSSDSIMVELKVSAKPALALISFYETMVDIADRNDIDFEIDFDLLEKEIKKHLKVETKIKNG